MIDRQHLFLTAATANKPPTIKCHSVPNRVAEKLEKTAVVTWPYPTASDPENKPTTFVYLINDIFSTTQ